MSVNNSDSFFKNYQSYNSDKSTYDSSKSNSNFSQDLEYIQDQIEDITGKVERLSESVHTMSRVLVENSNLLKAQEVFKNCIDELNGSSKNLAKITKESQTIANDDVSESEEKRSSYNNYSF